MHVVMRGSCAHLLLGLFRLVVLDSLAPLQLGQDGLAVHQLLDLMVSLTGEKAVHREIEDVCVRRKVSVLKR